MRTDSELFYYLFKKKREKAVLPLTSRCKFFLNFWPLLKKANKSRRLASAVSQTIVPSNRYMLLALIVP